jgi:cell division protein FtsQ
MPAVVAPADRRFRRAHVKPARRRSWLLAAVSAIRLVAAVVIVGGGGFYVVRMAAHTGALQVATIRVKGNRHLAQGEVMALLEGLRGQHILLTDLDSWRRRLLGSPWVEDAALRRVLPSTVEVVIHERQPMAIARLNGALYLVDDQGLVIDDYSPNYAQLDLPIVDGLSDGMPKDGPSIEPARAALASRLIGTLEARPELLQRVSEIDVTNPNDAVLTLESDSTAVHVGSDQFTERLQAYLGLSEALHARVPDIEYVDLRFADRVYVRPAAGGRHEAPSPTPAVTQR